MKYTLKGWLTDNALAPDKEEKILVVESAGTLTHEDLLEKMKKQDTGLRPETLEHAVKLYNRIITDALLEGYSVNTGLFRAAPQFRGVLVDEKWDSQRNSIHVSFTQDKDLREAIAQTKVDILGKKGNVFYILSGEDASTRATDGSATAGRNYIINGKMLKVMGDDPSVGITLTHENGSVTKLPDNMIVINNPSQLVILLPSQLPDGNYILTVTTQYRIGGLLKTPRSVSKNIFINTSISGEGGNEVPDPLD